MTFDRLITQVVLVAGLAWLTVGCGGFSASPSVSPASFFLPGLIQNSPAGSAPLDQSTNHLQGETLASLR